jgi:mono/diheme cytochrome c family protein
MVRNSARGASSVTLGIQAAPVWPAWIRRATTFALALSGLCGLSPALAAAARTQGTDRTSIERGRYLAAVGDCASCHTDTGGKPYAGGRAIVTPFGTIYSTNITPDAQTGIGKWSRQDFYKAMHQGIGRDGKHLYPAFPYPWFTKTSREDVQAIRSFLDSLVPVRQQNKAAELPWPLSVREILAGWNELFFHEGGSKPDPKKSPQWNRGAYLVEGLGHCGACHTATNALGAPKSGEKLRGGDFGEHWYAPGLTGNLRDGLGAWSEADIVAYLKTGSNAKTAAGGPMADVVKDSTQYLSEADLNAIAAYLKDIPADKAETTAKATAAGSQALVGGESIYLRNCTSCHRKNGAGFAKIFPSLKGSSAVQAKLPDTVTHIVLAGGKTARTAGAPTALPMPAFDKKLDDKEVAELVNYIRNAWGNHASMTSADEVSKVRKDVAPGGR